MLFQISVKCDTGVTKASCAECPNPLQPDAAGNRKCNNGINDVCTWCTGGGDCEIHPFRSLDKVNGRLVWSIDTCVSKYIFERSLVLRKVLNYVGFNLGIIYLIHLCKSNF